MKRGTHNLGRNTRGQLAIVRIDDDGLLIQLGSDNRVALSHDQARLLLEVIA